MLMNERDDINERQKTLVRIKKNIEDWHGYFDENFKRYHEFRKFIFETSITDNQRSVLEALSKPQLEFNILEAYISRLLGEFSMHEPSIEVNPSEGEPVPREIIDLVQGHIRHIIYEANKNSCSYQIYKDLLSGGFSVMKWWTEYSSPMSMTQVIKMNRVFDPTLCGFDPMARYSHKGDGNYSFELFPMTFEDFAITYPKANINDIRFTRRSNTKSHSISSFNWSYTNDKRDKYLMVGEYFEKKKKRVKICKIATGETMLLKNYKKMVEEWDRVEQPPIIIGEPRWTVIDVIHRYLITEAEIIEHTETDYLYLPHIFVDGNSEILSDSTLAGSSYQMTRPYVYQARGIQNLKNFAGQTLANSLENQVQHKFILKKEALPQEEAYLSALQNTQKASTMVVNAFVENDPDKPIPEPIREVVNVPCPPEVLQAFSTSDPTTQIILGNFSSNLGQQDIDMSGKAIIESATVGNAAAMPYVVGYLQALTQLGNCIVDLIPKYLVGDRHLPIVSLDGETEYVRVNAKMEDSPRLIYDPNSIHVQITPGLSFQVQKNQALAQLTALMRVSEQFNAFMNSEEGLPILVKNLNMYGADELREAIPKWQQKQAMMQQQQMQIQQQMMQNNPDMIKAHAAVMKEQNSQVQHQADTQIEVAKLGIEDKLADAKIMEAESKMQMMGLDFERQIQDDETSRITHALDLAGKMAEVESRKHQDALKTHASVLAEKKLEHEVKQANKSTGDK